MNNIQIIQKLEEAGIPADQIDEVAHYLEGTNRTSVPSSGSGSIPSSIPDLQIKMQGESDWKKRAQIAAQIISLRLDE